MLESAYSLEEGTLKPERGAAYDLAFDEADGFKNTNDYLRALVVLGLSENVRIVFLNIQSCENKDLATESIEKTSIGYFVTHFNPNDKTAILVPGDALEESSTIWLNPILEQELIDLGSKILEEFSLHTLAKYITDRS